MYPTFHPNIIYSEDTLNLYAQLYNLTLTDCIKDDGEITISDDIEGEPVWAFRIVDGNYLTFDRTFKLAWQDDEYLSNK
jgi:hypothetical protein